MNTKKTVFTNDQRADNRVTQSNINLPSGLTEANTNQVLHNQDPVLTGLLSKPSYKKRKCYDPPSPTLATYASASSPGPVGMVVENANMVIPTMNHGIYDQPVPSAVQVID